MFKFIKKFKAHDVENLFIICMYIMTIYIIYNAYVYNLHIYLLPL